MRSMCIGNARLPGREPRAASVKGGPERAIAAESDQKQKIRFAEVVRRQKWGGRMLPRRTFCNGYLLGVSRSVNRHAEGAIAMYMRRLPLCLVQRGTASFPWRPQVSVNVRRRVSTIDGRVLYSRGLRRRRLHALQAF